jgi:hypothetical protein
MIRVLAFAVLSNLAIMKYEGKMIAPSDNKEVYDEFIDELMNYKKITGGQEGSFRATIKINPFDRYSGDCVIHFKYLYGSGNYQISVHVDDLLRENEKYSQGLFPSAFYVNKSRDYPPMIFQKKGSSLYIYGYYFKKEFEVIITPI